MTLDLKKYAIVADVWEGSAPIDEEVFKANGVEALIVRMNTSWGGLVYDANFLTEWKESSQLKRAVYVVESPLNVGHIFTSKEYVDWILSRKPVDCTIIAMDVEINARVLYNNATITPKYYSDFLMGIFAGLHAAGMTCIQYSGAGYYAMVQPWVKPDYVDQWWARYMNVICPPVQVDAQGHAIYPVITWPELMAKIAGLNWTPLASGFTEAMTGRIVMWQVTDRFVLPGCPPNQPVDINIILRTDFDRIFGGVVPSPSPLPLPLPTPTYPSYKLNAWTWALTVRTGPDVTYPRVGGSLADQYLNRLLWPFTNPTVTAYKVVNGWIKISETQERWCALSGLIKVS